MQLSVSSHSKAHDRQERDVQAAALAECQRTILALGKQLKGLGTVSSQNMQEERETSPKSTNSSRSIEKMTENMELLRWQTEAADESNIAEPAAYNLSMREHGNQWANTPSPRRAHRSPSPAAGPRRTSSGIMFPMRGSESPSVYMSRGNSVEAAASDNNNGSGNHGQLTPKAPSPARSDLSMPGSPATTPWALRSRASKDSSDAQMDSDASVEKSTRSSSSFSRFYSRTRSESVEGSFG